MMSMSKVVVIIAHIYCVLTCASVPGCLYWVSEVRISHISAFRVPTLWVVPNLLFKTLLKVFFFFF